VRRPIRALRPASRGGAQRARAAGFTLLEILVVVLIIGVMTAVMVLTMNFSGQDTPLQTESERLLSLMQYARDQAELQTRNYGIVFSQHGYEFVVYGVRRGAWRRVFEDDALRERTLPSGLDFKLVVDARPIVLSDTIAVPQEATADSGAGAQGNLHPTPHPIVPAGAGSDSNSDSSEDSSDDADSGAGAGGFAPQVMIFSSGDLSSFKITVERPSAGRSITLDENQDGNIVEKKMIQSGS
jgi:general secretion pathway protein H